MLPPQGGPPGCTHIHPDTRACPPPPPQQAWEGRCGYSGEDSADTWQCVPPQVCGSPDIPLHLLKSVATYKGVEPSASLIQWFWEVMESFSNTERSLFLRFVWGRTRLPRTIADFRGRDFVVQVGSRTAVGAAALPTSLQRVRSRCLCHAALSFLEKGKSPNSFDLRAQEFTPAGIR